MADARDAALPEEGAAAATRSHARGAEPHAAHREATARFAAALVTGLADAGLQSVVVSPGSRSTPLALAAFREQRIEVVVHHDERSAGFFALGMARASGRTVGLLCTSGSAAANYLPAVVEAWHARVPLVVMTADRPPELRDCGAGQTIDQRELFGTHARAFVELPVPGEHHDAAPLARSEAKRAVACALGRPAGPVHLNCPFREPLEPPLESASAEGGGQPGRAVPPQQGASEFLERRTLAPTHADVDALVALAAEHERGLVAVGPIGSEPGLASAVARFSRAAGWPVTADPLSQLRRGPESEQAPVLAHSDLWLRHAHVAGALRPTAVLRIGAAPTSKAWRLWLEAAPPREFVLVDPDALWHDPSRLVTRHLPVDPVALLEAAAERMDGDGRASAWLERCVAAERAAARAIEIELAQSDALLEPEITHALAAELPARALLSVASSMPIRDVDAFLATSASPATIVANRGANGIDGTLSTALGAARSWDGAVLLLTGDLAFLHDIGGLSVARRLGLAATIVVMNNDGGGIFSFLPIADRLAKSGESAGFETLFHTSHGIDLAGVAPLFGIDFERVHTREALSKAIAASHASPGVQVIEVPVDRDANVERFRALVRSAGSAAARALGLPDDSSPLPPDESS